MKRLSLFGALALGLFSAYLLSSPASTAPLLAAGTTRTVAAGASWNICYQASQPGDVCKVSAGSYGAQTLAYRGDLAGRCDRKNPSSLIQFDASASIDVNGELEVDGPCVGIIGQKRTSSFGRRAFGWLPFVADATSGYSLDVHGEVSAFGADPQHVPDNDLFQGMHSVHIGALASDHTTFDSMDVGPATVIDTGTPNDGVGCTAAEGPGDENKVVGRWVSGGSNHTPVDIVISNSDLHNQQGRNPDRGDCHYGGLFIVNVDGFLMTNSRMYGNVVYNVQIQNFTGPSPTGIKFVGDALGCPVLWLDQGAPCDGQYSIQLNTTSSGITGQITGNNSANGAGGIFGCEVSGCQKSGVAVSGNNETPSDTNPPPLPGGGGTTSSTSTTTSTSTTSSTTTSPPPDSLPLKIVSQTTSKVTVGWTPAGNRGYVFYTNGKRVSNTFDPTRSSVVFARKAGDVFKVEAINVGPFGSISSP